MSLPTPFRPFDAAVRELSASFGGAVLFPGDDAYDDARALWNGMIDKRPAVIARCRHDDDVAAAVRFARAHDLPLAVRGGGHNVAGLASADGGVVIDLGEMNRVEVDADARLAHVQGGATLGDLDAATQVHGLATPAGVVSLTGVGGLTLGGGLGWLRRKYGLSCDNLVAAEVVTATGEKVRVSETENADLLWGLRGGGGNFGIVTSFTFTLHPVGPEVAFTFVFYPLERAREVLRAHEAFLEREPGEVSTIAVLGRVPHAEIFDDAIHGLPFVGLLGMYAGDAAEGLEVMRPLREVAAPIVDLSGPMPYVEAQQIYDEDYPNGMRYYWKSTSLMALPDAVIDLLVEHAEHAPSDHSTIDVWYHGGAVAARGETETAYGRRDIPYLINPEANWEDAADDEANIAWARALLTDLKPFSEAALYLNFPGFLEEGNAMMRASFGANYERLVDLKTRYDPKNVFRFNQNIMPRRDAR